MTTWSVAASRGDHRHRGLSGALFALILAVVFMGAASPVLAAGTAVFSAPLPASGASVLARPLWLSVRADDTRAITSASMTLNGGPIAVNLERPVGSFVYDDEQESVIWVPGDLRAAKPMSYNPGSRVVPGVNTVVATVTSANGVSTYSWTFNYGTATTISAISPAANSVIPSSPPIISASLTSPSGSFASTMTIDGTRVPLTYSAGSKTYTHTPTVALAAGVHTVVLAVRDSAGGTVTRTWSFKVSPPMSTGNECTSCHTTYPAAHPVASCADCHDHAYADPIRHGGQIPTAAGCNGDGTQQYTACHRLDHASDSQWGIWGSGPFTCVQCHNSAFPRVPRHTDASTTAVHMSTSVGCGPCHSESLLGEHGKYPTAATIKFQCDLCHGAATRQQVKDAVAAGRTDCSSCHAAADHFAAHSVTVPADCSGCHPGSSLTTIHALPGCDGCHTSSSPAVVTAIATHNRDCSACHVGDPHPVAVHTAGGPCVTSGCHAANVSTLHSTGPSCTACHAAGKTPSLVCTTCHTGTLHVAVSHTTSETCYSCHATSNLVAIHGDDCSTCHPTPESGLAWNRTCKACHPTRHASYGAYVPHRGEHDGGGPDCWDCHDITPRCFECHKWPEDRTPPVTTANAVASYINTATITLSRTDVGNSGIRTTYYQLDGGELRQGTVVIVYPPVSGTATHTLDFWSTDNGYNTEIHRRATFSVRRF